MPNLPPSPRGTLFASALGFVVVLLDVSVVNVALDDLRRTWHADMATLQWVVNAYTLVFAALLLTSGALGDRLGARRVFLAGFAVFTLASVACGLAPGEQTLIAARLLQGLGAALLVPNSLSMLQRAFKNPQARSHAVGWWGAAGGIALAAGPVLGGILVEHWGWRSIFLINLPVGVVGMLLTQRFADRHEITHPRRFDWPGQVTAILALAAFASAIGLATSLGWSDFSVWGGLLAAGVLVFGFVWIEAHSPSPMLPLSLFRQTTFSVVSITGIAVNFAYYGLIFVFSLFFQVHQHLSPQQTGLAFLPMTLVLMLGNIAAGQLMPRWGARRLLVAGLTLAALGYWLTAFALEGPDWPLALAMMLAATGISLTVPTMTNVTLSAVDASRTGIASGVLNSARQVGGMLGVGVCGYLIQDPSPDAFLAGMRTAIGLSVVLLVLAALLCLGKITRETAHEAAAPAARKNGG